jgi:hypothetical protein
MHAGTKHDSSTSLLSRVGVLNGQMAHRPNAPANRDSRDGLEPRWRRDTRHTKRLPHCNFEAACDWRVVNGNCLFWNRLRPCAAARCRCAVPRSLDPARSLWPHVAPPRFVPGTASLWSVTRRKPAASAASRRPALRPQRQQIAVSNRKHKTSFASALRTREVAAHCRRAAQHDPLNRSVVDQLANQLANQLIDSAHRQRIDSAIGYSSPRYRRPRGEGSKGDVAQHRIVAIATLP